MSAQPAWTGLQIETGFFPLSFFLYLCTPTMIIDGVACQRPKTVGRSLFSTGAGSAQRRNLLPLHLDGPLRRQFNQRDSARGIREQDQV